MAPAASPMLSSPFKGTMLIFGLESHQSFTGLGFHPESNARPYPSARPFQLILLPPPKAADLRPAMKFP